MFNAPGLAQVKVAELGIHALDRFPNDREISQVTFMLLAFSMIGPKERKSRLYMTQHNITEKCDKNMEWFRCDTQVIAGITKMRDLMPLRVIKPTPEMKFEEEKKEESDDDSEDEKPKEEPAQVQVQAGVAGNVNKGGKAGAAPSAAAGAAGKAPASDTATAKKNFPK